MSDSRSKCRHGVCLDSEKLGPKPRGANGNLNGSAPLQPQKNRLTAAKMEFLQGLMASSVDEDLKVCNVLPRKSCYIQHVESGKYLRIDETNHIALADLRHSNPAFSISRLLFDAMNYRDGDLVSVFAFKVNADESRYISVRGTKRSLAGANLKSLGDTIHYINCEDPRFFLHEHCGLASLFQSTQLPGYYLASDGNRVFLKYKEKIDPRNDHDLRALKFEVKYPDEGTGP